MNIEQFKEGAYKIVDWMVDYLKNIEKFPVKSAVKPGEIMNRLPQAPPEEGESVEQIFEDFKDIILPGITHWQHPAFFAYFPANNSYPSILGEMLTAALGAQCMSWETSPAATELEERVMKWTAELLGIPGDFTGVIQDTASTSTLCSILTAREKFSNFKINQNGFYLQEKFVVYCSKEAHSSIEKAVKIAVIGRENLRKIEVDHNYAMLPEFLEETVKKDISRGYQPLAVVVATGTTGSTAIDPLKKIGKICNRYGIWIHVDAAYAGTGLLLEENRWMIDGIEMADTFVFNPHKWMFTNFDCSAYFVKDKGALLRTFEILPEYLKTKEGSRVNNYRDWGIQLGRRFRALKLWFVIRTFGVKGLKERVRSHIKWAQAIAQKIKDSKDFELMAPVPLATLCFRYKPGHISDRENLNSINATLLEILNNSGKLYLTHTKLNEDYSIRFVIGQTYVQEKHVLQAWELIKRAAHELGLTQS